MTARFGRVESSCRRVALRAEQVVLAERLFAFAPRTRLPGHPNAMTLEAWADADARVLVLADTYYSIGGGFIRREGEPPRVSAHAYPLAFDTAEALIDLAIDDSVDQQQYVEDCHVCCRPINIAVAVEEDGTIAVQAWAENEA